MCGFITQNCNVLGSWREDHSSMEWAWTNPTDRKHTLSHSLRNCNGWNINTLLQTWFKRPWSICWYDCKRDAVWGGTFPVSWALFPLSREIALRQQRLVRREVWRSFTAAVIENNIIWIFQFIKKLRNIQFIIQSQVFNIQKAFVHFPFSQMHLDKYCVHCAYRCEYLQVKLK